MKIGTILLLCSRHTSCDDQKEDSELVFINAVLDFFYFAHQNHYSDIENDIDRFFALFSLLHVYVHFIALCWLCLGGSEVTMGSFVANHL